MIRTVLALLFCVSLQAQDTIELRGKILNDTIEKTALNVVNISLKKGTITNQNGEFNIPVRINDTINVSAVQYESQQFVVTKKIFRKQKVSFYLVPRINNLDEVFVDDRLLSGVLDRDAGHNILQQDLAAIKKADEQGLLPDLSKKTTEERRLHTTTSGTGEIDIHFVSFLQVPLAGLINRISGKRKKLQKHLAVSNDAKKMDEIQSYFPKEFYVHTLEIPENMIEDFVAYLFQDQEAFAQINQDDVLELLDYMMIKSKQYVALKAQEH